MIVTTGERALIGFLAGYSQQLVGSMAVGIGTTAASASDEFLELEVDRVELETTSADYVNGAVVYKAVLPSDLEAEIRELGVFSYSRSDENDSAIIVEFNSLEEWTAGTLESANSRLGEALRLSPSASTTDTASLVVLGMDLSGYSNADTFTVAYRPNNANVSSAAIRFVTSAGNYYELDLSTLTSGVYSIVKVTKGSLTSTGSPDWSNITQIDVVVTATGGGAASIDFDAVRIDDTDGNREEGVLVSRNVLGTPIVKTAGSPMTIEYTLTI